MVGLLLFSFVEAGRGLQPLFPMLVSILFPLHFDLPVFLPDHVMEFRVWGFISIGSLFSCSSLVYWTQ